MSVNGHCFVEWKEQFVSQECGNRVVHYFLKDSAGECILASVGTEMSLRHMSYVVAEEFAQVGRTEHSVLSGFKWRSRQEVVDWLTSRLSKKNYLQDQHRMVGWKQLKLEWVKVRMKVLEMEVLEMEMEKMEMEDMKCTSHPQ